MARPDGGNAPTIEELEAQERDLVLDQADLGALHALGRLMSEAKAISRPSRHFY